MMERETAQANYIGKPSHASNDTPEAFADFGVMAIFRQPLLPFWHATALCLH